jgi:hypothetical protein
MRPVDAVDGLRDWLFACFSDVSCVIEFVQTHLKCDQVVPAIFSTDFAPAMTAAFYLDPKQGDSSQHSEPI